QSLFSLGLRSNMSLTWPVLITLAIQIVLIYWEPLQNLLPTEALSSFELGVVLLASTIVFWAVEGEKLLRRVRSRRTASLV
ncbi:MAG: cation transporting ATPase C-terminal domain-containing protein, partial [Acidimicrobiia bacterium]